MLPVSTVANYFLTKTDEEAGDTISNLKLQKLLYFAQGFYLAITEEPLFVDSILAWRHGPVVRSVYGSYAGYGASPIPPPENFTLTEIDEDTRDFLDEVYEVYGQFSAWRLREMTHEEPPWRDAWDPDSGGGVVTQDSMKEYFSTLVE